MAAGAMTRVALLRHYPTGWNAEARLQGRTDVPLADASRSTLATLAMPQPWNGARLFASPLARAAETASMLAGGRDIHLDRRLVEISWGAWEGRRAADLAADARAGFRPTHEWGPDDRAPHGESPREAWERIRPALAEIAGDPAPAVLVLHKAMMRLILGHAGVAKPEIRRGRLYPLTLAPDGAPGAPGGPARLEPR